MYYFDIFNQIALLTVLCFSFFIFIYNLYLNRNNNIINILAFAFLIPLSLYTASFVQQKTAMVHTFTVLADLLLVSAVLCLLSVKIQARFVSLTRLFIISLPVIAILCVLYINKLSVFLVARKESIALLALAALANIYVLRKEKGNKRLILWAVLCLASSGIIKSFDQKNVLPYLFIILKLLAYILFMLFFHKEIYSKLTAKIIEAEKKLTAVNKSLDLEVKKRVFEIERSNQKLVSISKTDALTKAYNKAAILEVITNLMESKSTKEFTILMFDIDKFKTINDTLGHLEGDKCIKKVAVLAHNSIREIDSLGRYGGDEFIIVLPEASLSHAKLVAERFRKKVAESSDPHYTVSIGIANYPNDAQTLKDLIAIADEGLYQSKKKGRNAVSHRNLS